MQLTEEPPGVRDVRDTNECHIHSVVNGSKVVAIAAIDNLWKGASGQAIQNLNLMLGLDETEGLADELLPLPLGAIRRTASRSSTRLSWRPGSAPPGSPAA